MRSAAGHDDMTIGLDPFRDPTQLRLNSMLVQPLMGPPRAYPINRRSWAWGASKACFYAPVSLFWFRSALSTSWTVRRVSPASGRWTMGQRRSY